MFLWVTDYREQIPFFLESFAIGPVYGKFRGLYYEVILW